MAGEAITVARAVTELTPATLHVFANPLQTETGTRVFASLTVTVTTAGTPVVVQWSAVPATRQGGAGGGARLVAHFHQPCGCRQRGRLKVRRNGTAIYTLGERQTGTSDGNAGFTYEFPAARTIVDHPPAAGSVTPTAYL